MPAEHLFVYGLLRPDAAPREVAPVLRDAEDLGDATIRGELYDVEGGFPAAVPGEGVVHGRLLRFDRRIDWRALDRFEGCDGDRPLFRRERVELSRGPADAAWVYWFARATASLTVIAGGRWAAR